MYVAISDLASFFVEPSVQIPDSQTVFFSFIIRPLLLSVVFIFYPRNVSSIPDSRQQSTNLDRVEIRNSNFESSLLLALLTLFVRRISMFSFEAILRSFVRDYSILVSLFVDLSPRIPESHIVSFLL